MIAIRKIAYPFKLWIRVWRFIWTCFQESIFQWAILCRLWSWLHLLSYLSEPSWRRIWVSIWNRLASHAWRHKRSCFHRHIVLLVTARVGGFWLYATMAGCLVFKISDLDAPAISTHFLSHHRKRRDLHSSQWRFKWSHIEQQGCIEASWEVRGSTSWEKFKMLAHLLSLFLWCMI